MARADRPGEFATTDFGRGGRLLNVAGDGSVSVLATGLGLATGVVQLADNSFVVAERTPGNARLLQIPAGGGTATPLSLSASIGQPYGLDLTSDGDLVVSDFGTAPGNGRLVRVALDGTVTVLATGGVVGNPTDVIQASNGNFVATDFFGQRLVEVNASGALVQAESLSGSRPAAVLEQGANQYAVTDFGLAPNQGRILEVQIGVGVTVVEDASQLQGNPYGIAASGGLLYVTDLLTGRLLQVGDPPGAGGEVNTLVDENDTGADCSLREAIIANNTSSDFGGCTDPQGTITFANSLMGTMTLTGSGLPAITEDVVIDGPGSTTLAVSGANSFRVFDIVSGVTLEIEGLTIADGQTPTGGSNFNRSGGGIRNSAGTVTISNSTLSGNSASVFGGGILNQSSGSVSISNSTLSGNSANSGGGIFNRTSGSVSTRSTIISGNTAPSGSECRNDDATLTSQGNNLFGLNNNPGGCPTTASDVVPTQTTITSILSPLANNGGPTQTQALPAGSPAIDAGANPDGLTTDQRGLSRTVGAGTDIGSFEVQ